MTLISSRLLYLFILIATVSLILAACSPMDSSIKPDVVASIESIQQADNQSAQLLVTAPGDSNSDRYIVTVNQNTSISWYSGRGQNMADINSLAAGQQVYIWLTGPVMESYPAQAVAASIIIMGE